MVLRAAALHNLLDPGGFAIVLLSLSKSARKSMVMMATALRNLADREVWKMLGDRATSFINLLQDFFRVK